MEQLIIVFSLIISLLCYLLICLKDKSFFNALTPLYIVFIPSYYVLELIHINIFGPSGSVFAYFYSYLTYSIYFLAILAGYVFIPIKQAIPVRIPHKIKFLPYIFFIMGFVLYLPIIIKFRDLLSNPREIYELTRTGFGLNYFLSTTFTYLGFILFLYNGSFVLPFLFSLVFLLLHGSKGQVFTLFLLTLLFNVYVKKRTFNVLKTIVYTVFLSSILVALFSFSLKNTDKSSFLAAISEYSDYNRNTFLVIDYFDEYKWGKLTFEEFLLSRIPRAVYPDKPKDFGTFYLAKKYYPDWFDADTGSPSFGLLGVPFADFGYFAIFYILLFGVMCGIFMNYYKNKMNKTNSPGDFIMFIFFCGITLIPTGAGYLIFEHYMLAIAVSFVLRIKVKYDEAVPSFQSS